MSYNSPYERDAPFDPYAAQNPYGGGGYVDRGYANGTYHDSDPSGLAPATEIREKSYPGSPVGIIRPPLGRQSAGKMRRWRREREREYQGNLWTKGSRWGCFGRFFCCTIMIFLLFLISILLSLALWLRPPNIIVSQPTPDLSTFAINDSMISFDLPVAISVNNPNYFTVDLASLDASVIYPIPSQGTEIGKGHMENIPFKDHTQTNFTFPVTIAYNATSDPSGAVLLDLARHCGLDQSVAASDITVSVNIKLGLKVMLVGFSTPITQKVSFGCPLGSSASQLEQLLKGLGINVDGLAGLLGAI